MSGQRGRRDTRPASPLPELLVDRAGPLRRAALLDGDGRLLDLQVDRDGGPPTGGPVFLGRVDRIVPGLDAAFLTLGAGLGHGFLPGDEVRGLPRGDRPLAERVSSGRALMVQVRGLGEAGKAPALTMDITLPGRFLIHRPVGKGLLFSKRLADATVRSRLEAAVAGLGAAGGWILRSSAADAEPGLLAAEAAHLAGLAATMAAAAAAAGEAPRLLLPGLTAAQRAIVERGAGGLDRITVGGAAEARALTAWCRAAALDLADRVASHEGKPGLFDFRGVADAVDAVRAPNVPLPGGGGLVIERTAALTAIDVNGGERGTLAALALDAAREVVRQVRLRNIGGAILVDFPRLPAPADFRAVLDALKQGFADDPTPTQVHGPSRLGLVEIARARRGVPLADLLDPPTDGSAR